MSDAAKYKGFLLPRVAGQPEYDLTLVTIIGDGAIPIVDPKWDWMTLASKLRLARKDVAKDTRLEDRQRHDSMELIAISPELELTRLGPFADYLSRADMFPAKDCSGLI